MATQRATLSPGNGSLSGSVAELEACFGTPVIPGSLLPWLEAIEVALDELEPVLRHEIGFRHRAQLIQIGRGDAGGQRSVDHLQQEDRELLASFDVLRAEVARLSADGVAVEPDEAAVGEDVARLATDGLWFVIRVRRQDTAIRTWLGEALNRESGAGD